jgi:hypothetical protein
MKFRQLRAFCRVLQGNRQWSGNSRHRHRLWLRTTVEGEDRMAFCPLTYAFYVQSGEAINVSEYLAAGRSLGFTDPDIADIAAAGDGDTETRQRARLWRILRKACGLTVTQRRTP